jgi:hypothetical protein
MRKELGREERRFLAAGAGTDFEDDVFFVVRVLGNEQRLQICDDRFTLGDERLQLLLGEVTHLGVAAGHQLFGLRDVADDRLVVAKPFDDRLDLRQELRLASQLGRVVLKLRRSERAISSSY